MEAEFIPIRLEKADPEIINKISETRSIPAERVKRMMAHKCWTVQQFAELAGKTIHTINNLTVRGKQVKGEMVPAVTMCSAFPTKEKPGPKFIVRDELSMEILIKSLK